MAAYDFISKTQFPYIGSRASGVTLNILTVKLPFVPPDTGDFDPRKCRTPVNPVKPWMAYFNLIRLGFGPGFLGIPLAVSQAGIVMGPIICIAVGFTLMHTQIMLLNCLNEVSRQLRIPRVSYRHGFRLCLLHGPPIFHCLGDNGPTVVTIFMVLNQLSYCTVCYISTVDSLRDIMDWQSRLPGMIALLIPYLLLQHYLRTMMQISVVAMTANVMTLGCLFIMFYHIFQDPLGEITPINAHMLNLLFCFSTVLFNMSSFGIILAMDRGLQNPEIMTKRFGVIELGVMIPSLFAAVFGSLGYWSFGTMEDNIIRSLPCDDTSTIVCMSLNLIVVMLTYSMQTYPGTRLILDVVEKHDSMVVPTEQTLKRIETVSRTIFVLVTFLICYLVPFQGPFVALCGSLCTNLLAIVFPCMMEICLLYPNRYGRGDWILIKDLILITIGGICWIAGVFLSGYLIFIREKALEKWNAFEV